LAATDSRNIDGVTAVQPVRDMITMMEQMILVFIENPLPGAPRTTTAPPKRAVKNL
jgi:hypothetical protein